MQHSASKRITSLMALLGVMGSGASLPVMATNGVEAEQELSYPRLLDYSTSARLGLVSEGDRRLGLMPGEETDSNELGIDVKPEWVWQLSPHWRSKLRLQAFAATGQVDISDDIGGTETDGFVALREAWIDYNGLTAYPGESIRLGRERLKEDSGMWWDDDLTLVRWIVDTSLLDATVGMGQKLAELRTDANELPEDEQDIARFFATTRWQWRKDHYLSFLLSHGEGVGNQAGQAAARGESVSEGYVGSLTWAGVSADRAYFDWHSHNTIQYFASLAGVTGSEDTSQPDPAMPSGFGERERDVNGWAADLGLRAQLVDSPRWVVGVHGAMASGGGDESQSDAFRQTGLESNRSRFTGTRSQIQRFGEAVQPQWRNLKVATVYTALTDRDAWAANLLYHRYWLNDADGVFESDLIEPGFAGSSDDLGESIDLVLDFYGDSAATSWAAFDVRLRGGVFLPGQAYGDDADDARHRVVLDLTKRF
ncbi:MAG: alginate export family protein [Marinobacter sp.]|nr:alginate export family protein [Marinobacter sp.]